MNDEKRQYMTVDEAASRLDVDSETVRRWIRSGHLAGYRIGGRRAGYRIPSDAVERLLARGVARR